MFQFLSNVTDLIYVQFLMNTHNPIACGHILNQYGIFVLLKMVKEQKQYTGTSFSSYMIQTYILKVYF